MFGHRFGQTRFGLGAGLNDVPIRVVFADNLKTMAGFGANITVAAMLHSTLSGESKLTVAIPAFFAAEADLQSLAAANANMITKESYQSACQTIGQGAKNIYIREAAAEQAQTRAYSGKNIHEALKANELAQIRAYAGKDIIASLDLTALLMTIISANILESETVTIEITLQPGDILQIDSDTYNVFLNGANAIHLQSGDWITIDKSLVDLIVDSGTGGELNGKIMYYERYL